MPWIHFVKKIPAIEVQEGANLMQSLLQNSVPVASSCGGDGICSKCKVEIISGEDQISKEDERESILKARLKIPKKMRLSCQVKVFGDVTVDTPYW